jgi:Rhodopirellula transposase DDE domain/Peptidase family M20/M25/M40
VPPPKKAPQTDALFAQLKEVHAQAAQSDDTLRLSMDGKMAVPLGPFSRGGSSRLGTEAADHDFKPNGRLTTFGLFLPGRDEFDSYFTASKVTSDFIVDVLDDWQWAALLAGPPGRFLTDDQGRKAKVKFTSRLDYYPFRMKPSAAVVKHAEAAAVSLGMEPKLRLGNGGLDANWLVKHGIPTVTFGVGQNAIHTVKEWVDVPKFLAGCRMALAVATRAA